MTSPHEIVERAARVGALLRCAGEKIRIVPLLQEDVPGDLVELVRAHKVGLLSYLAWQEAADALLLESTRRIMAHCPVDTPLDTSEWREHDVALHVAYWSQDLEYLRRALAERERFAAHISACAHP